MNAIDEETKRDANVGQEELCSDFDSDYFSMTDRQIQSCQTEPYRGVKDVIAILLSICLLLYVSFRVFSVIEFAKQAESIILKFGIDPLDILYILGFLSALLSVGVALCILWWYLTNASQGTLIQVAIDNIRGYIFKCFYRKNV